MGEPDHMPTQVDLHEFRFTYAEQEGWKLRPESVYLERLQRIMQVATETTRRPSDRFFDLVFIFDDWVEEDEPERHRSIWPEVLNQPAAGSPPPQAVGAAAPLASSAAMSSKAFVEGPLRQWPAVPSFKQPPQQPPPSMQGQKRYLSQADVELIERNKQAAMAQRVARQGPAQVVQVKT